ncbi:Ppx/GppA phosphatase family protein [Leptothrix discophora]|uniref:Ppx/GppA phosphatase family protein n=1 Tax=Leptothrix discophora TaxID=89 RepID=A0ABT9G6H5_LEPDI|nr:Ppx/GppA phosphatase family protein [Leptothrix discophora]MDP4302082.1 Ppx/GppA phosphatase family protein [Leptothrix discophora]
MPEVIQDERPVDAPASTAHGQQWRGVLAAVDMGSNSFRLELAQIREGQYRRIAYLKETVRLGGGLGPDGRLSRVAVERALACLARFRQRLGGLPSTQLRAVATQTLREASNRDEFLFQAEQVLGYPIEVISGREEARLIYTGVSRLEPAAHARLVIDIGGRSTELIVGEGEAARLAESFQIGSVSLSERYFPEGRCTEQAFREAQIAAGAAFEEVTQAFGRHRWKEVLGSSGTAGAAAELLEANGLSDGTINEAGLRWCMRECIRAGTVHALKLDGLREERRAVLPGGVAILSALLNQFGIDEIRPTRAALRQGVIFDLSERIAASRAHDRATWRDETVRDLQRRFEVDLGQAQHVRELTLALYDRMVPNPPHEARQELAWAAALHEIGMSVSHHDHHRHSAYLLAHIDAPGFSQSQQRRLADLVLGQRGGLRKIEVLLADPHRAAQVLALRLAVLFFHARSELLAEVPQIELKEGVATLTLDPAWAKEQPRCMHLLREEQQVWARIGDIDLVLVA